MSSHLKVFLKYFYRLFCFNFEMPDNMKQKKFRHHSLYLLIEPLRQKRTIYPDNITPDSIYRESMARWLTSLGVSGSKLWACK